ncbi:MAG TPA: glycosyltransferase family 39 protein [Tepidisphaeraceae bacterium]|jgi:hypothetical protein
MSLADVEAEPRINIKAGEPANSAPLHVDPAQRARRILLWLMLLGAALRILRYLADRSLWLDEAYLANSILTYSFKQLLTRPLMHWQAAPAGFLLLQKLAVTLFGGSEYALRIVPLLAGLASIPLFYGVIRRCLTPTGQVLAMGLFVLLDPLIYYAAEAKQYGLDVTVTLAILWAALRVREDRGNVKRMVALAIIGVVGIFCSHPAVFTLTGAGIVLSFDPLRIRSLRLDGRARLLPSRGLRASPGSAGASPSHSNRDLSTERPPILGLLLVGLVWLAAFAADYVLSLRPLMHHAGLAAYWAADYMPCEPLAATKWVGWELYQLYAGYATMWLPLVDTAILATLIGFIPIWKQDRSTLALLILPLVLTLGAATVHAYPFGSRLVLFLVPSLVVLIGAGSALIWESVVPRRRYIAALILLSILLPTAARDAFYVVVPQRREEIRPVLAYIRDHKRPGDSLYAFYISKVPFHYYADRFGLSPNRMGLADMRTIIGQPGDRDPSLYRADLARLRGKGRVWVLITHPRALGGIDEEQLFSAILDQWGKPLDHVQAFNSSATLYDMGTGS